MMKPLATRRGPKTEEYKKYGKQSGASNNNKYTPPDLVEHLDKQPVNCDDLPSVPIGTGSNTKKFSSLKVKNAVTPQKNPLWALNS